MKFICPLIVVKDIAQSRFLYETLLGQKVKEDYGENLVFEGTFSIHQEKHFRTLIDNRTVMKGSNNSELYFEENDLEPVAQKLRDNGFEFVHGIREQPWKQKVLRFYDYDKNLIEIGERLEYTAWRLSKEHYSIEEISQITYLPEAVVQRSIDHFSTKTSSHSNISSKKTTND